MRWGSLRERSWSKARRAASEEAVQQDINDIRRVAEAVAASRNAEALPEKSAALRERIEARLLETATKVVPPKFVEAGERRKMSWGRTVAVVCLGGGVVALLFAISFAVVATKYREAGWAALPDQRCTLSRRQAWKVWLGEYTAGRQRKVKQSFGIRVG